MFDLEIRGLDEAHRSLDRLRERAEALSGSRSVPLDELFPPSFMAENTQFPTLQSMVDASGVFEDLDDGDREAIRGAFDGRGWTDFVASRTRFTGWEEMLRVGGLEYVSRQLFGDQPVASGRRTMTDEAATILKAAAAGDGHVKVARHFGDPGVTVQVGDRSMIPEGSTHRDAMRWTAAVEDLETDGLIRDLGAGSVFEVTRDGYAAADALEADG